MTCISLGKQGFLCGTENDYLIVASDKVWRFEWHLRLGPCTLHKQTGDPIKSPPSDSPFWHAVTKWDEQGRRTQPGKGGTWAIWDSRRKVKDQTKAERKD